MQISLPILLEDVVRSINKQINLENIGIDKIFRR